MAHGLNKWGDLETWAPHAIDFTGRVVDPSTAQTLNESFLLPVKVECGEYAFDYFLDGSKCLDMGASTFNLAWMIRPPPKVTEKAEKAKAKAKGKGKAKAIVPFEIAKSEQQQQDIQPTHKIEFKECAATFKVGGHTFKCMRPILRATERDAGYPAKCFRSADEFSVPSRLKVVKKSRSFALS